MATSTVKKRSKEEEAALDAKIAEIRKKNQLIEKRKELVDQDRAKFTNEMKKTEGRNVKEEIRLQAESNLTLKEKKPTVKGGWDREWDAGKTSADKWKENVPEMERSNRAGHSWGRHPRGRGSRGTGSSREFNLHDDRTEDKPNPQKKVNRDQEKPMNVSKCNRAVPNSDRDREARSSCDSDGRQRRGAKVNTRGRGTMANTANRPRQQQDMANHNMPNVKHSERKVNGAGGHPEKRINHRRSNQVQLDSLKVSITALGNRKVALNANRPTPPTNNARFRRSDKQKIVDDATVIAQLLNELVIKVC